MQEPEAIDKEPAFKWWVPHTLKKRQVILSALKKRIRKTTQKYGIEIPTSVEHAFELDRNNGNNLWKDALNMEMYNIGVAFVNPRGWENCTCWIHQGIRSPNLVCEDGLHKESKTGAGWLQDT